MMAKMFYTLEEAAERLQKSVDEVREMASSGQLQEFRDRDKLMFKVDQVDLLAGDDEPLDDLGAGSGAIPLADSGMGSGLDLSASDTGSGFDLADSGPTDFTESPKERTGVSVFDVDDLDDADPSAVTQVTDSGFDDATLEAVGSGSGLMDLTRESDDTSLGAVELLDDIYPSDEQPGETIGASGLFEATGAESDVPPGAAGFAPVGQTVILAEPYDGAGSGLVGGLSMGVIAALALSLAVVLMSIMGAGSGPFVGTVSSHMMAVLGAIAGVAVIGGAVGFFLGKRS